MTIQLKHPDSGRVYVLEGKLADSFKLDYEYAKDAGHSQMQWKGMFLDMEQAAKIAGALV